MYIIAPAGIFSQISNASFFFAALFGDILLVRLFLSLAYIFLLVAALLGQPRWPGVDSTGIIFLDTAIWSIVSGALHTIALVRLLLDERRITFKNEDEEQLWRFFYRRSGMGRFEMKQVLKLGRWRRVAKGDVILNPIQSCSRLCLMVEGLAEFTTTSTTDPALNTISSQLFSGSFFDMRLLNVFGLFIGFEGVPGGVLSSPNASSSKRPPPPPPITTTASGGETTNVNITNSSNNNSREEKSREKDHKWFAAIAQTNCIIYEWSIEELNTMATGMGPAVSKYWRNLLATQIGLALAWREVPHLPPTCGTGESESPAILFGMKSRDFTDPLRRYEQQQQKGVFVLNGSAIKATLKWLYCSIHPLMPPGVRHNDLPVHGIMARNRIVALKQSQLLKAARVLGGSGSCSGDNDDTEEKMALRALRQLESLRSLERTDVVKLAKDISIRRRGNRAPLGRKTMTGLLASMLEGSVRSDPGPSAMPPSP